MKFENELNTNGTFTKKYFEEIAQFCRSIDLNSVENLISELIQLRESRGRLFIIGMGGSAANASHAATDLRKLCEIETYSPADNISEITATANDFGLDAIFVRSLQSAHMNSRDCLLVFSVGGGDEIRKISLSLINAVKLAKEVGSKVFSILGRANSFVNYNSDVSIVLPRDNDERVTPHSESLQAIVWHLLTCHPRLKTNKPTW